MYAAADTLYKEGTNVTTSSGPSTGSGTNQAIEQLTVGGVTIGDTGADAGKIIANNIVGITNTSEGTLNDIHINGATFASGGAITANGGLTTNSVNIGGLTISSLVSGSTTSATNYIAGIKDSSGAVTAIGISGTKFESNGAITASSLKLDDGIHPINNVAEAIGNNKDNITTLQTKTTNISYNATTGTTVDGVVLKDKGITAADGKFTVKADGQTVFTGDSDDKGKTTIKNGETVVEGANGKVTINNGGIEIAQKAQDTGENYSIKLDSGYVKASGFVEAPKFYIDNNNVFEKEADGTSHLTVSDVGENGEVTKFVRIGGGTISASGDVNVVGSLWVGKTSIFNDGINTDKIDEKTTGAGVTVEGVKFKAGAVSGVKSINNNLQFESDGIYLNKGVADKQIKLGTDGKIIIGTSSSAYDTDGFYAGGHDFDGAKAAIDAKDGKIKGAGGKFSVDKDGNTTVGGTLDVTGDATLKGKLDVTGDISTNGSVTAKGGLSAANGNFTVDGTTGDTTLKGKLDVTGDTTLKGKLDVTGKATLKDELQVDKKATFGSAAGSQTVINGGDITADGQLNAKSARIGGVNGVGISDSGVITGVTKLTTKALEVTDDLVVSGDITGAALKGTSLAITGNGTITGDLGVTGAITGVTINGATITTNSFNGATIGTTTFNGVTLTTDGDVNGRNMTASGTIKGKEITDGAGASMNAGTVTGTKITDGAGFTATGGKVTANDINATTGTIAGVGFTANNVSGINNLTATGTIQGAVLKVNDKNLLDSNGLKAEKAVIDNLTIDGASITSNNADGSVGVAGITVDKTGAITGVKAIDGVAVTGNTASGLTIGTGATAVTIGGNSLALSSTNFSVDNDGDVKGQSFTAGTSHLKDGELKLNAANIWNTTEGIKTEKAVIGANTLDAAGISTTGTLGVKGQATFGDSTSGNYTTVNGGKVDITANGGTTTIEGAKITTKTLDVEDIILRNEMKDGTGATINIKGSDGSMSVASGAFAVDKEGQLTNKITGIAGGFGYETKLETSKSGIKANYTNAINGNQNIIDMGASGISIGVVSGTTPSVGAGFKAELDAATMGYGTANSIVVNKDTIKSALGTDVTRVMTNNTTEQSIVDKVGTASRSLKADEIVDTAAGMTITTNNTGTTFSDGTTNTLIKGSAITSTKATGDTGVLDGSNLTLKKGTGSGAKSTALTAGGATFTKDGKTTTISGDTITTGTLNVKDIVLGGTMYDTAGHPLNGKLSIGNDGHLRAANGNFDVKEDGTFTNTVGNTTGKTTLKTDTNGASMKFDNTAATGGVKSEVAVADDSAKISAGASSIEVKNEGITNTGKTTFKGAVDSSVPTTETTIDGNTIKTGHLITDKLTITGRNKTDVSGRGDADGTGSSTGSIAFGGDGTIKSDINDGTNHTTFETKNIGTTTTVSNSTTTTKNEVKASGNTNTVTDIATSNNTESYQTVTSIGGVVTKGTVKMRQELTADGMKVSVDGDTANYTQITNKDVSITDPKNAGKRINLSDLGQLNNLDSELTARDEYKDNKTAVGAINAEAGIRREEVARLDNRIDDVNNRVDKVGAMAAAIASLKSIGYDPQAPSEFSIGLGQYKGETGVAMGFFHYPNKNFMINVSLSTAGGETMGGIGATWRFGHKSPQKLLEEQREAQARKELAAAEKYQAAAKLAKEAQERAEYAAKLARQAQVSADNAKAAADATQAKHFQ